MLVIRLDGKPLGKGRPRFNRASGRAFTPERTARFEDRLAVAAQAVMAGRPLLEGPLMLEMVALMPVPVSWPKKRRAAALAGIERPTNKPDADNIAKMVDALNLVVWTDDAQIVHLGPVLKFYSDRPALILRVGPAPADVVPAWAQDQGVFS